MGCGTGVLAGIVLADRYEGVDVDEQSLTRYSKMPGAIVILPHEPEDVTAGE